MKRYAILLGAMGMVLAFALPAIATTPEATFLDTFAEQAFTGNDGNRDFAGPWTEIGESNGPTSGYVWVSGDPYCADSLCLKMGGTEGAVDRGAYRAVDLSAAVWAKLSFKYGRYILDDSSSGTAIVQISANMGGSWTKLKTISLDEGDDGQPRHESFDITGWASSDTMIRFIITDEEGLAAYWMVDDVMVEATFEPEPTTTTSKPGSNTTTTSKPEPTTTTTKLATTTTSKFRPSTTTTSKVPRPTTTTEPEPTTTATTIPRTTTTAEAPGPDHDVSPEDLETMMEKSGLAVMEAMPPSAMPASMTNQVGDPQPHAEPVEALAAAFSTDAGNYGGNLLPSVLLGVVIVVVLLLGMGTRKEDE